MSLEMWSFPENGNPRVIIYHRRTLEDLSFTVKKNEYLRNVLKIMNIKS